MLRFLADEDFDNRVLRGLLARRPDLDIVRVQDVDLSGLPDPLVLTWAAHEGRILLTHDKSTMVNYARESGQATQCPASVPWKKTPRSSKPSSIF